MNMDFWGDLPPILTILGGCTWLTVAAWAGERRREREAYYKSESIKKIAEMQGHTSEAVLQILSGALTPSLAPSAWWSWSPKVAATYYQSEVIKEIARTTSGGGVLEFLREQERIAAARVRQGLRLGGSILVAVGIGLMPFLRMMLPEQPVFLVGLIPMLIGAALLTYSYVLTPQT